LVGLIPISRNAKILAKEITFEGGSMLDRIKQLLDQIQVLEDELATELHQQEHKVFFQLEGKKIEFEKHLRDTHRQLKTGLIRWLFVIRPINIITAPIIYAMIIPLLTLDLLISFYQLSCFPIYKITKVRRADYIVIDRHHLMYLNFFERAHCMYCSYANGLVAYSREILARTEQYFCPIKHAHKVLGTHARYRKFFDYGDAEDYHQRLELLRQALAEEK
jgi:hypothetical protein